MTNAFSEHISFNCRLQHMSSASRIFAACGGKHELDRAV